MSKIKITLIVFLSFLALSSSAHRRMRYSIYDGMLRTGFHIGVSGSVNSTWILNQNNYNTLNLFYIPIVRQSEMDYVFTWGGQVGVTLGYNFIKRFGIEFEPSFSWAGQTYDDNFVGPVAAVYNGATNSFSPDLTIPNVSHYFVGNYSYVNVRREIKFTYLQFPIYAKYQTHIGDIASYYIMLGPQFNVRNTASENIWVNHYPYTYAGELSVNQRFQKYDYGMSLKTGVDIYANDWMYFDIGVVTFIAFNDLNGDALKSLGWYSKNDVDYQKSHSFYMGLHGGIHVYLTKKKD
jgi:hypothetical protein